MELVSSPAFRADRRLFRNTFVEISIDDLRHERTGRFNADGKTADLHRLDRAALRSWRRTALRAGRRAWRDTAGRSDFRSSNQVSSSRKHDAGVAFGGGVAVRAGDALRGRSGSALPDPQSGHGLGPRIRERGSVAASAFDSKIAVLVASKLPAGQERNAPRFRIFTPSAVVLVDVRQAPGVAAFDDSRPR